MFCAASRPLAHPACPAAAPAYAPAVPSSEVSDSVRGPRPVSAEIAPHPDAVAGGSGFSVGDRRRLQAEADNHPLATRAAAIEPATLAPASTLGSTAQSTSPSQSRLPLPRWPCEADEGWRELLGLDLTVLAPPPGHPVRKTLAQAREDRDFSTFAMALMEKGVPPPQIFRAAMLCGMLPMQDRSDPEASLRAMVAKVKAEIAETLNSILARL
jgi:hypothetical protein